MNHAIFAGNLGQDCRTNTVGENDTPVANFSLAVNERRKGQDVTTWVDCALFGKRAESLAPYLAKGSKVTVGGSVSADKFTKDDGAVVVKLKLFVTEITLQGGKQQSSVQTGQGQQETPSTPDDDNPPVEAYDEPPY